MEQYKIYSLNDPITNEVRYVGKTVSPLYKRLSSHFRDKTPSYKTNWINSLKEKGLKPTINILEITNEDVWQEREKHWISVYKTTGRLTNYLDGGQGQQKGYKHSDEAKIKISLSSKKNKKGKFVKGFKFSKSVNEKRANSLKKEVYQFDKNGNFIKKWSGIIDASTSLNINKDNIRAVLTGRSITAGGFIWSYTKDKINLRPKKSVKPIIAINVNDESTQEFNSIAECSKILMIDRKHIDYCLTNENSVKNEYKFKYKQ